MIIIHLYCSFSCRLRFPSLGKYYSALIQQIKQVNQVNQNKILNMIVGALRFVTNAQIHRKFQVFTIAT